MITKEIRVAIPGGAGKIGRTLVESMRDKFSVEAVFRQTAHDFGGGVQTSMSIANALERSPNFLILATPNPTGEVLEQINESAKKPLTLVLTQNGIGASETAREIFAENENVKVVRAAVFTTVGEKDGELVHGKKRIALASDTSPEGLKESAELFKQAGFKVETVEGEERLEWTKLLANMIGATGAITGLGPKETFSDADLFRAEIEGFRDRVKVMEKAGIAPADIFGLGRLRFISRLPIGITSLFRGYIADQIAQQRHNLPPAASVQIGKGEFPEEFVKYYLSPITQKGAEQGSEVPLDTAMKKILDRYKEKGVDLTNASADERKALMLEITKYVKHRPFTKALGFIKGALESIVNYSFTSETVRGQENLDKAIQAFAKGKKVIFVPNHNSHLDHPLVQQTVRKAMGGDFPKDRFFIIAGMLFRGELSSQLFQRAYDHFTVWTVGKNPTNEELWKSEMINRKALREYIQKTNEEPCMVEVCIEGSRGEDNSLIEAKPGSSAYFRKAVVVPVALTGTREVYPPNGANDNPRWFKTLSKLPGIGEKIGRFQLPKRGPVAIEFGEPMKYEDLILEARSNPGVDQDEYISGRVMRAIAEMLPEDQRGFYSDTVAT